MSADWAKLEGQQVNGAYPLQRCIGSTGHSGVYLTQSTPHAPSAVALKLVPFFEHTGEAQLARWREAAGLSHPHLIRIFEVGECHVDGKHCLYARMEYADQTLAQLLERRALTEAEVREMLGPTLEALEYLHDAGWVQGSVRPSNFLVVGERLKLASDTLRPADETDPDEGPPADVLALGLTLCEALTQVRPSGQGEPELPAALSPSFRRFVLHCLARDPRERPTVARLQAWLRGEAPVPEPPAAARPSAPRLVIRVELPSDDAPEPSPAARRESSRRGLALGLAGLAVLAALGWIAYRAWGPAARPPEPRAVASAEAPPAATPPAPEPRIAAPPAVEAVPPPEPDISVYTPVDRPMPQVSRGALDTIRGTVRVSVRALVDSEGKVVEATAIDAGPSRYFERHSLEAARKWRFPSTPAAQQRAVKLRFAFTRSGVKASSEPLP